jgi:hypothetical protein
VILSVKIGGKENDINPFIINVIVKLLWFMVRYVSLCNLTQSIEETETCADGIIETAQDKGVFTSLLNAGL